MKFLIKLIFTLAAVGILSCSSDKICSDSTPSPSVAVEFYKDTINKKTGKHDVFKYTLPDTLTVQGVGTDSIVVKPERNLQRVLLPPNIMTDNCTYVFTIYKLNPKSGVREMTKDELKFTYERKSQFVSHECGFKFDFLNTTFEATENRFDSLETLQKDITNEGQTALRIYFK
ncbi:hypothetical protein C3K47_11485 [Solitalea longa]|uniref:Lipoprotein n=1 Tax=Solitalea longa TaxID=2079460 RepID=A0A2S5A269_9SPHI|nr:DUF6452 family protein [Solitalea longa]POY36362.1 hypothetical protein C3K47_11485 [Solitalea longa]